MKPIDNKYTVWYFNMIESRKNRKIDGYAEKHHIIPRSLGGANTKENIILLYPREHFIAHALLTKMFDGTEKDKMGFAFGMMLVAGEHQPNRLTYKPNSKLYDMARRVYAESISHQNSGRVAWNRGIPRDDSVKKAVSDANKGRQAWNKGKKRTDEERRKMKEGWEQKLATGWKPHNAGKKLQPLTDEHKAKISAANKGNIPWNK